MGQTRSQAVQMFRDLGDPDAMWQHATSGTVTLQRRPVNSHIHLPPNFSAFTTVEQAVTLAAEQHIKVLGASNYYDFAAYGPFADYARRNGIVPLYGLEIITLLDDILADKVLINDPGNFGKMYICGKGITNFVQYNRTAEQILDIIRGYDSERMSHMIARLSEIFRSHGVQINLDAEGVIYMVVKRHGCQRDAVTLQERHVALAFQEAFCQAVPAGQRADTLSKVFGKACKVDEEDGVGIQSAIRSNLMKAGKPAFIEDRFVDYDQARQLILALGGIPCYPTLADGADPICGYEQPVEELIEHLRSLKLHCAEFIPVRNSVAVLEQYVTAMRQAGIILTAGTEHNTLDLIPIEPTCTGGQAIPDAMKDIFWEGTCVVAAHQFLGAHGREGYVDDEGNLCGGYDDHEQRIAAFASLGQMVIDTYLDAQ